MRPATSHGVLLTIMILGIIEALLFIVAGLGLAFSPAFIDSLNASRFSDYLGGGVLAGIILVILGVVEFAAAAALRRYRNWARVTMIVFGLLTIWLFPLGTLLGILCLVALVFDRQTVGRFKDPQSMPPERRDRLHRAT